MEKQPSSRMRFVCGIEKQIGLHLAFYTDDEGRCLARFGRGRSSRGIGCIRMAGRSARC